MFLIVISALFGAMHVSAAIAYRRDAFDRGAVLRKLLDPAQCRFERRGPEGAWTWHLVQNPAPPEADVFHLTGSFINFAGICGLPFARLRSAIPEDLISGTTPEMARATMPAAACCVVLCHERLARKAFVCVGAHQTLTRRSGAPRACPRSGCPRPARGSGRRGGALL